MIDDKNINKKETFDSCSQTCEDEKLKAIAEEYDIPTEFAKEFLRIQSILDSLDESENKDIESINDVPKLADKEGKLSRSIFGIDRNITKDACARHMYIVACLKKHEDKFKKAEIDIITESLEAFFDLESKSVSDDCFEMIESNIWPHRVRTLLSMDCKEWAERLIGVVDLADYPTLIKRIKKNKPPTDELLRLIELEMEYYKQLQMDQMIDSFDVEDMKIYFSYLNVIRDIENKLGIGGACIEKQCVEFISKWTPKNIAEYLRENIVGQNEAINMVALSFYNHVKRIAFASEFKQNTFQGKQNVLLIGPSGCGKSEIFRLLKNISPVHITIEDSSSLTAEGFSGLSKSELIESLCNELGGEIESAIIVLDEADKLCRPQFDGSGSNISFDLQGQLLKLLEGDEMIISKNMRINTKNIMIVLLGTFSEIDFDERALGICGFINSDNSNRENNISETVKVKERLKQYGVLSELLGRITYIVRMNRLNDEDYRKIISNNVITKIADFYGFYNDIVLKVDDSAIEEIVAQARECDLGARELQNIIYSVVGRKVMMSDDKCIEITKKDIVQY